MTSDSAMLRNSARRLERQGFGRAAEQMALQGEQQRIAERSGRATGARSAEEEAARNKAQLQTQRAVIDDTADAYLNIGKGGAPQPAAPVLDNRDGQNPVAVLNSPSQSPTSQPSSPSVAPAPTNGSGFSSRPSNLRDNSFTRESFADTDRRKREELTASGAFGRGAQRIQEQRIAAENAPKETRISQPMRKPLDPMVGAARGLVEDEKAAKQKAINDSILAPMRAERAAKEQADAANKAQIAERSTSRSLLRNNDGMTGAASGATVLDSARNSTPTMDKVSALKSIGDSSETLLANQSALDDIDMGLADNNDFGGSLDRSKMPTLGDALTADARSVTNTAANTVGNLKDTTIAGAKTAADLLRKSPAAVNQITKSTNSMAKRGLEVIGQSMLRGASNIVTGKTGDILRRDIRR